MTKRIGVDMADELTKETIRQEALESWRIGADTGKFYARVINALMHNKIKIEDLPLDLMKGFRLYKSPQEIKNNKKRYKNEKPLIKFKNSEKTGNILSEDIGGMSLVSMWVRTDSFELIKDEK